MILISPILSHARAYICRRQLAGRAIASGTLFVHLQNYADIKSAFRPFINRQTGVALSTPFNLRLPRAGKGV